MTKVVDKRTSASDAWLQQAVHTRIKRGEARMIAVEWTESKHPSKVVQQRAKETWDVVVRDWHGYEFCRRAWPTEEAAQKSEAELKAKLMGCDGDVLAALSAWAGHPVQVPLWWGG